ncbi:MAG: SPOR domain-containing protein [Saprospiraceae bacterium]|nr:SPOR domain-containing protein [Saprospiraceae bacterium]
MKQIDVAECIGELLYERDAVIVPGLGAFASTYQKAGIDHVQGLLHPPSKEVGFNDNLSMNDGVLMHYIQQKFHTGQEEAKQAVEEFVEKTRKSLDNREIVVFPKIGRLYLDFEQQFKFLQDNTNFNSDSFGLPTVHFYPVVRYQKTGAREIRTAAVTESLRNSLSGGSEGIIGLFQRSMPWVILLSIAIITISIYFINRDPEIASSPREEVPADRVNISPTRLPVEDETIVVDEPEPIEDRAMVTPPVADRKDPELDTEAPTIDPGTDSGVIIIGAFGDIKNAEKLIQKVYEAGYDAYSDRKGKSTRVGVRVLFNNRDELEEKLETVQSLFNEKAWILE